MTSCAAPGAEAARALSDDEFDSYYLQGSQLKVVASTAETDKTTQGGKDATKPVAAPTTYEVMSIPVESTGCKLTLQHNDQFWASTNVKISKTANTDLIATIGTEVTDNRVVLINTLGSIAKTSIGFLAAGGDVTALNKKTDFPYTINLVSLLTKNDLPGSFQIQTAHATIDVGPLPPDAVPLSSLTFPLESRAFLYAACRPAVVHASVADGDSTTRIEAMVKIADPNYIQRVQLPNKGTISMHAQCGVSVVTDAAATSDAVANLQVLQALATQIGADKQAYDSGGKK